MSEQRAQINVGIIGYGFMGQTHARAYQRAQRDGYSCLVQMIADPNLDSLDATDQTAGNLESIGPCVDHADINLCPEAAQLITNPNIDLISICTHTDSHVELAIRALEAGKHVLVEKPIALASSEVESLALAARSSATMCMPAMCMRFWPAWVKIKEQIDSRRYGDVRSAVFHRLGSRPRWSPEFYTDQSRSGGVLHDLHIHDTDFIVHCFGIPNAVTTSGDSAHLSTIYRYHDGPIHVLAHAAWDHQPAVGFEMRCSIVCERATIDFDINRDDQLILHEGNSSEVIEVGDLSGYDGEIRWMLDCLNLNKQHARCSMDDAARVARILEIEHQSMNEQQTLSIDLD
jgi:predicted dehydrogenase